VRGITGLALTTEPVPPVATNTLTPRRTRSLANPGTRSICPSGKAIFDGDIVPLDKSLLFQPLAKGGHDARSISRAPLVDVANHGHRRLLRCGRERYGEDAPTHDADERSPVHHRRLSSARTRIDCGIVKPRALAVLRLMTNSNFVGCSTGRSAGLAPLRIFPT